MDIIFAGSYKTSDFGGVNSYMLCISKQLIKMGHNCTIIRQARKDEIEIIDGVRFINLRVRGPKSLGFFFFNLFVSTNIVRNNRKADVICFQTYFMNNILSYYLRRRGYLVTSILHSFACDNPKNGRVVGKTLLLFEKLSTLFSNNLITVGGNLAKLVEQRLGRKPWIIRGGIFLPSFDNDPTVPFLSSWNLRPDEYYLIIARIDPVKKIDVLINGFLQYNGNKKLVVAGNIGNDYGKSLIEMASSDQRIIFVGSVFGKEKEELLQNCFAYCLVSSSEGFPISLLEAMSYKKRCIVTKIDSIIEALGEENGIWCRVDSAEDITSALELMDKEEGRKEKEALIFSRVSSNFTWEKSAKAFLEVIDSIKKLKE